MRGVSGPQLLEAVGSSELAWDCYSQQLLMWQEGHRAMCPVPLALRSYMVDQTAQGRLAAASGQKRPCAKADWVAPGCAEPAAIATCLVQRASNPHMPGPWH